MSPLPIGDRDGVVHGERVDAGGLWSRYPLALVWVVITWAGVLFVLGSTVVPAWVAGPALLLAGTVVLVGPRLFGVPRLGRGTRWWWMPTTLTVCAWVAIPAAALFDAYGDPSYVVVQPAGSAGCRAVVEESSFLFAGSGTVHVAGGWGPFVPRVGRYTTDDGFRPVSTGVYSVSWNERSGGVLDVEEAFADGQGFEAGDGSALFDFEC